MLTAAASPQSDPGSSSLTTHQMVLPPPYIPPQMSHPLLRPHLHFFLKLTLSCVLTHYKFYSSFKLSDHVHASIYVAYESLAFNYFLLVFNLCSITKDVFLLAVYYLLRVIHMSKFIAIRVQAMSISLSDGGDTRGSNLLHYALAIY